MLRRIVVIVMVCAGPGSTAAGQPPRLDATPFAHAPCSVLSGAPCTPTFCSVFNAGPCIPELDYPIGQNLQLTVLSQPAGSYRKPDHALDTIGDLFAALRACWSPPSSDSARTGMQVSVKFSFRKSGEIFAPPRLTFASRGVPAEVRDDYLAGIGASLRQCAPLNFTPALGGAIAGRPIMVRYVDNRALSTPSNSN
jgi:hypothetical protein